MLIVYFPLFVSLVLLLFPSYNFYAFFLLSSLLFSFSLSHIFTMTESADPLRLSATIKPRSVRLPRAHVGPKIQLYYFYTLLSSNS